MVLAAQLDTSPSELACVLYAPLPLKETEKTRTLVVESFYNTRCALRGKIEGTPSNGLLARLASLINPGQNGCLLFAGLDILPIITNNLPIEQYSSILRKYRSNLAA